MQASVDQQGQHILFLVLEAVPQAPGSSAGWPSQMWSPILVGEAEAGGTRGMRMSLWESPWPSLFWVRIRRSFRRRTCTATWKLGVEKPPPPPPTLVSKHRDGLNHNTIPHCLCLPAGDLIWFLEREREREYNKGAPAIEVWLNRASLALKVGSPTTGRFRRRRKARLPPPPWRVRESAHCPSLTPNLEERYKERRGRRATDLQENDNTRIYSQRAGGVPESLPPLRLVAPVTRPSAARGTPRRGPGTAAGAPAPSAGPEGTYPPWSCRAAIEPTTHHGIIRIYEP